MNTLTGTGQMLKLMLRLDRIRLSVWILVLGLLPVLVAASFAALYETEVSRQQLVSTIGSSPGLVALLGPVNGSSIGALATWRVGIIGAVLVAIMAAFTTIRHTRLEEQTGRRELLGSTVLGRNAPLAAATAISTAAGVVIGAIGFIGLAALGESLSGALAFGLGWAGLSVVFGVVGALAAQLTESAGSAKAVSSGVIGVFFVLRMAGDGAGPDSVGWLTWLSPIGWFTKLRPFGDADWRVLVLWGALAVVVGSVAYLLSGRRDVGAGLFQPRSGPAVASPTLASPSGLAWRLQRSGLVGWSVAIALFATVWGGLGNTMLSLFEENPQLAQIFEALGGAGALTDAFFGAAMGIMALIVSAYAVGTALTLRTEETEMRADPVLATATPRLRWALSHIVYAVFGPILMMGLAGLTAGLTYGAVVGDVGTQVANLLELALLQVPAIWVVTGVAVALYGFIPRLASLSWGALVAFLLLGQLGRILQLPQWALNLSPFSHVPIPPTPVSALPLLALAAIAALLAGSGLKSFVNRDMN